MLEEAINAPPSHNLDVFFMARAKSLKLDEVDAQIADLLIGLLFHPAGGFMAAEHLAMTQRR